MLGALWRGGAWWGGILAAIAVWGALELGDLFVAKGAGQPQRDVLVCAGLAGFLLAPALESLAATRWVALVGLLLPTTAFAYAALRAWARGASVLLEASAAVFAFSYVGVLMGFWWLLRSPVPDGWHHALLALLGTWGTDVLAYSTGKLMGRRRLLPRVSPGKTVEGAVGGLAGGVGTVVGVGSLALGLPAWWTLGLGVVVALAAELGDLAESALKRDANVKDSGWLLPGHGGILDRMDSALVTGLAAYLWTLLVNRP